ncbi:MAG: glycosyltransferase family 4 protein, partial [Candidatus Hodarchaeota archaeon]
MINKFYYVRGGTERYCFDMTKLLQRKGHTVIPFSMRHDRNRESEYAEHFVEEISFERSTNPWRPLTSIKAATRAVYSREAERNLEGLIRNTRPDIAYLHNIHHHISLSILPVLKKHNIPAIWRLHDYSLFCPNYLFSYSRQAICEACSGGRYYQVVLRKCRRDSRAASLVAGFGAYLNRWLRLCDLVDLFVAPSHFLKEKMVQHGLDAKRLIVIPNFIELSAFEPLPPPSPLSGPSLSPGDLKEREKEEEGYLLYFGRLSKEKGLGTLIEAVAQVPDIRLKIVGDGPQCQELQALAKHTVRGRVEFAGYQPTEELITTLKSAQMVVLPSEWYENCPYTILEAFAARKPVIASNIGGIPELVEDRRDGLLFEPGNSEELTDRLRLLLHDR